MTPQQNAMQQAMSKALRAKSAATPNGPNAKTNPRKGFQGIQNSMKGAGTYKHSDHDGDEKGC